MIAHGKLLTGHGYGQETWPIGAGQRSGDLTHRGGAAVRRPYPSGRGSGRETLPIGAGQRSGDLTHRRMDRFHALSCPYFASSREMGYNLRRKFV
ncbi:MAG: hypothetical protein ABIK79_16880 [Chloroflexota bacterium]